jgi:hypothetical protein
VIRIGTLPDQRIDVVEVVRRLLEPESARLRLVAHPAVVVAARVERDIIDRLHLLDRADGPESITSSARAAERGEA